MSTPSIETFGSRCPILLARDCSFGSTALLPTNANRSVPTTLSRVLVTHFRSIARTPTFGPPGLVLSEAASGLARPDEEVFMELPWNQPDNGTDEARANS